MDIHQILKLLPHRYPILLVDRVLAIELGKSIRAVKNVTINEPFFTGHFPHRPVMPGVLMLEAMAQGTPVVTSRGTSTEEVAGGAAVLVDPMEPADIARGVAEALERRDDLVAAGHARARSESWTQTAQLTARAYRDAAR